MLVEEPGDQLIAKAISIDGLNASLTFVER